MLKSWFEMVAEQLVLLWMIYSISLPLKSNLVVWSVQEAVALNLVKVKGLEVWSEVIIKIRGSR